MAITLAFSVIQPINSHAATFTVINTLDTGTGSLRRAVFDANNAPGDDKIVFDTSLEHATINLSSGEIAIGSTTSNDGLTITGPVSGKANGLVIDAGGKIRIFKADAQTEMLLTLENITLTGGITDISTLGGGPAIYSRDTNIILNDSVITGNFAMSGGGGIVINGDDITLNRSVISDNLGVSGGGISEGGGGYVKVNFYHSVASGNSATYDGGAIKAGRVILHQSTVSNNTAGHEGGAISSFAFDSYQSTLSGNTSSASGSVWDDISLTADSISIVESTITNNTTTGTSNAGALDILGNGGASTLTLVNTILSGNTGTQGNLFFHDVSGGSLTVNATNSLFGDPASEITGSSSGVYLNPSNNPDLGPLNHNGGLTQTHRPNVYSPATNSGSNAAVTEPFDQRGFTRIVNTTVDMGSVEREPVVVGGINEVLKRGEMAKALLEAIGTSPELFSTGLDYHDVQAIDANSNWISKFKQQEYSEGCDTNKFCANSIVTRLEMAKIFFKIQGITPTQSLNYFDDVLEFTPWAGVTATLRDQGYTAGCDTNKFCPNEPVTREWFEYLLSEL